MAKYLRVASPVDLVLRLLGCYAATHVVQEVSMGFHFCAGIH